MLKEKYQLFLSDMVGCVWQIIKKPPRQNMITSFWSLLNNRPNYNQNLYLANNISDQQYTRNRKSRI